MPAPRLIQGNPSTYNPNAPSARDVRPGDIIVDLTGAVGGASLVVGAPGAFSLLSLSGGGAIPVPSDLTLTLGNPGGAGTVRATVIVRNANTMAPLVGATVELSLTSPSAMIKGVAGPVGSVAGSVLDGDSATSLTVIGQTGIGGVCDFDITGTAAAVVGAVAIVLDPLPTTKTAVGAFTA